MTDENIEKIHQQAMQAAKQLQDREAEVIEVLQQMADSKGCDVRALKAMASQKLGRDCQWIEVLEMMMDEYLERKDPAGTA